MRVKSLARAQTTGSKSNYKVTNDNSRPDWHLPCLAKNGPLSGQPALTNGGSTVLDIARTLLDIGKTLFGLRSDFEKTRRDRRERLAVYFSDLAALIESVSASLRLNRYPHGSCAQLQTLASLMKKTVKGIVTEAEAQDYQDRLMRVWEIEQLFDELQGLSKEKAERKLVALDEAAGYFRALAAHLWVV